MGIGNESLAKADTSQHDSGKTFIHTSSFYLLLPFFYECLRVMNKHETNVLFYEQPNCYFG